MSVLKFSNGSGTQLLGIDQNGYVSLGNSTPVGRFTVNGISFYDDNGNILNQRVVSESIHPTVGSIAITFDSSNLLSRTAKISTSGVIGREPIVTISATFGVKDVSVVNDPDNPGQPTETTEYVDYPQVSLSNVGVDSGTNTGFFVAQNNSEYNNTYVNKSYGDYTDTYTGYYVWI